MSEQGQPPAPASSDAAPAVAIGTSSFRQQYLFAFASQPEVRAYLRTQLAPDQMPRIPKFLAVGPQHSLPFRHLVKPKQICQIQ
jgi:hypothetical protein